MTFSFKPIEIEYSGFLITREPTHNLISILPKPGSALPDALLSKYTEVRIAKETIDKFMREQTIETAKND